MGTKKCILVIDDDQEVRETICENLKDCGYEVFDAGNGALGLDLIEKQGFPDLIITDIIMPEMGGLETIAEIRKKHSTVKVIAISGGGRTQTGDFLEMAAKSGADATMPKPINIVELERTIEKFMA